MSHRKIRSSSEQVIRRAHTKRNKLLRIEKALQSATGKGREELLKRKEYWENNK